MLTPLNTPIKLAYVDPDCRTSIVIVAATDALSLYQATVPILSLVAIPDAEFVNIVVLVPDDAVI